MGPLLWIVARLGIAERFQRLAAGFVAFALLIGLQTGLWALHAGRVRSHYNAAFNAGWTALAAQDAAEAAKARKVNEAATATADSERATDTTTIINDKEARDAAIKIAPAAATGAATRAANCVRWKRAHPAGKTPPACR